MVMVVVVLVVLVVLVVMIVVVVVVVIVVRVVINQTEERKMRQGGIAAVGPSVTVGAVATL